MPRHTETQTHKSENSIIRQFHSVHLADIIIIIIIVVIVSGMIVVTYFAVAA